MDDYYRIPNSRIILERQKAVLVKSDVFDREVWIPKSQIHDDSEVYDINSPEGDLLVLEGFAKYRGWI